VFKYNDTWELVATWADGLKTIGYRWMYTLKVGLDGEVNHLKSQRTYLDI